MNASPQPRTAPPEIAIQAPPPSPRRLSRKVLLAGGVGFSALIVLALVMGLSDKPRRAGEQAEAAAGANAPPDTIRLAPPNYDARNMDGGARAPDSLVPAIEAPPGDIYPERLSVAGAAPPAPSRAAPEADPDRSPILYSVEGPQGAQRADADRSETSFRLQSRLTPVRSQYEVLAGSVISAALLTELNSDVAGQVVAQVTTPVYDSVAGNNLLIPQGSRLIGAYRDGPSYGDVRLAVNWERLILPNGASLDLQHMAGTDPSGAAGLRDQTDNHIGRLARAVGLSAVMSVAANEAEDDNRQSLSQSLGDAAAQEAARTGGRIVDRELSVRPTLRVRVGAPVRVLVERDIRLRPYQN